MSNSVLSISYNEATDTLRRKMDLLQHRAVLDGGWTPEATIPPLHDPTLNVLSFYICADSKMVSYAGVVRKSIEHCGEIFKIAGMSCVATDRDCQRRGFGTRTVAAATRWIEQSDRDFGIFTCDPPLAQFYAQAGGWPIAPDVVLVGSADEGALSSAALHKVVLMRLFSAKAQSRRLELCNTTINLDLPVGQFL